MMMVMTVSSSFVASSNKSPGSQLESDNDSHGWT